MGYTEIIYLLSKTVAPDSIGNQKTTPTEKKTYAKLNKVGSKEFYSALSVGITPEYEFQIRKSNYNGEDSIKYNNKVYQIIRTIPKSITDIVLVVGTKAGKN